MVGVADHIPSGFEQEIGAEERRQKGAGILVGWYHAHPPGGHSEEVSSGDKQTTRDLGVTGHLGTANDSYKTYTPAGEETTRGSVPNTNPDPELEDRLRRLLDTMR